MLLASAYDSAGIAYLELLILQLLLLPFEVFVGGMVDLDGLLLSADVRVVQLLLAGGSVVVDGSEVASKRVGKHLQIGLMLLTVSIGRLLGQQLLLSWLLG